MTKTDPGVSEPMVDRATRRRGVIIVASITAGVLLLIGGLLVALYFLFSTVLQQATATPSSAPPIVGAAGGGAAVDPMLCPEDCYSILDIEAILAPDAALTQLGVRVKPSQNSSGFQSTQVAEYNATLAGWRSASGAPDECFFTYFASPVTGTVDVPPQISKGDIQSGGTFNGIGNGAQLQQSVRVFATSQDATDHLETLNRDIAGCRSYSTSNWKADVTAAAGLELPESTSAVGWVEDSPRGRYYAFDVQRGNLVIRAALSTDGGVTESDFRAFVVAVATHLASVEPQEFAPFTQPVGCAIVCITVDQARRLVPGAEVLAPLGPAAADPAWVAQPDSTIGDADNQARTRYIEAQGDPLPCFFTFSPAPISPSSPDFTARDDAVLDLGRFTGDGVTVSQTARVLASELYAGRFPGTLRSPIIQCADFSYEVEGVEHHVSVVPLTVETGSQAVAAAGWSQKDGAVTRTVVDLQYRNVVVRIVVDRPAGSSVTDEEIRAYVGAVSAQLAGLG
jgi:hypothetical protein